MDIKPFGDIVVMEPLEAPKELGGILLPESGHEALMQRPIGVVVAVGPDANKRREGGTSVTGSEEVDEEFQVHKGDVVLYWTAKAGVIAGQDGRTLRVTSSVNIIGKVLSDRQATAHERKALEARANQIDAEVEAYKRQQELERAGPRLAIPG